MAASTARATLEELLNALHAAIIAQKRKWSSTKNRYAGTYSLATLLSHVSISTSRSPTSVLDLTK